MEPYVTISSDSGTLASAPIGERITLGSGAAAGLTVPGLGLAAEHILIVPRGDRCWVSVAQGASPGGTHRGASFVADFVPWGAEISIGSLRVRVDETPPEHSSETAADPGERPAGNNVFAMLVVVGLLLGALLFIDSGADDGAVALPLESPELFAPAEPCASDQPAYAARVAEEAALAKIERYVFDATDGIEAVALYRRAASCHREAGAVRAAAAALAEATSVAERIERDYRIHRLRLERALVRGDETSVLHEVDRVSDLVAHLPESDVAMALRRLRQEMGRSEEEE